MPNPLAYYTNYRHYYHRPITASNGALTTSNFVSMSFPYNNSSVLVSDAPAGGFSKDNGDDVRVMWWNGSSWVEVPRLLINFPGAGARIEFLVQANIANGVTDSNYYIIFGYANASAPAPPTLYSWYDTFGDGTLDTTKWATSVNVNGTVTETGGEAVINSPNLADDAAILIVKDALTFPITNSIRTQLSNAGSENWTPLILIAQKSTIPVVDIAANINPQRRAGINVYYSGGIGHLYIYHYDSGGIAYYWDFSTNQWTTTLYDWTLFQYQTYYEIEYEIDANKKIRFTIYDASGVLIEQTAWSTTAMYDTATSYWALSGDIYTDYYFVGVKIDWYKHGYQYTHGVFTTVDSPKVNAATTDTQALADFYGNIAAIDTYKSLWGSDQSAGEQWGFTWIANFTGKVAYIKLPLIQYSSSYLQAYDGQLLCYTDSGGNPNILLARAVFSTYVVETNTGSYRLIPLRFDRTFLNVVSGTTYHFVVALNGIGSSTQNIKLGIDTVGAGGNLMGRVKSGGSWGSWQTSSTLKVVFELYSGTAPFIATATPSLSNKNKWILSPTQTYDFIDDFSDGSINATQWSTSVNGSGTVTESGDAAICNANNSADDAAILVEKNALTFPCKRSYTIKLSNAGNSTWTPLIAISQKATTPVVDIAANINAQRRAGINVYYSGGTGHLYIYHLDSGGITYYWNFSTNQWTTTLYDWTSFQYQTYYEIECEMDANKKIRFTMYNASGALVEQTAWSTTAMYDVVGNSYWLYSGDPYTDFGYAAITIDKVKRSTGSIVWEYNDEESPEKEHIVFWQVWKVGAEWRAYYSSYTDWHNTYGGKPKTGAATSTNGIVWTKSSNNPILDKNSVPNSPFLDSSWNMFVYDRTAGAMQGYYQNRYNPAQGGKIRHLRHISNASAWDSVWTDDGEITYPVPVFANIRNVTIDIIGGTPYVYAMASLQDADGWWMTKALRMQKDTTTTMQLFEEVRVDWSDIGSDSFFSGSVNPNLLQSGDYYAFMTHQKDLGGSAYEFRTMGMNSADGIHFSSPVFIPELAPSGIDNEEYRGAAPTAISEDGTKIYYSSVKRYTLGATNAIWIKGSVMDVAGLAVINTEDLVSIAVSITSISDIMMFVEALTSTINALTSITDIKIFLENLQTQIASETTVSAVQTFLENVQTVAASVASIEAVQNYVKTVETIITSQTTIDDAIVFFEMLDSVIASVSLINDAQTFVEMIDAVAQSSASIDEQQTFIEQVGSTIVSISAAEDKQLFVDNVNIMIQSHVTITAIMNYIEQVQTNITSGAEVSEILLGAFVGVYVIGSTVAARTFEALVEKREFDEEVVARSFEAVAQAK